LFTCNVFDMYAPRVRKSTLLGFRQLVSYACDWSYEARSDTQNIRRSHPGPQSIEIARFLRGSLRPSYDQPEQSLGSVCARILGSCLSDRTAQCGLILTPGVCSDQGKRTSPAVVGLEASYIGRCAASRCSILLHSSESSPQYPGR
jgi:hypothetical protein